MSIFNKVTKTFQWGDRTVIMETGEVARQASGAVLVNIDDTVVLATVVASKSAKGERQPEFEGHRRHVTRGDGSQAMSCKSRKKSHEKTHPWKCW